MKIVIDLTSLNDNFSGIERYALNISLNLISQDRLNNYILLFKNEIYDDFKDYINNENIEVRVIKGRDKLFFGQVKLLFELIKIKADKYLFLAFPSPILFRRSGIINTIHDLTAFLFPETMKLKSRLYFKYSIINAVKISKHIITVSETSKKDIVDKFGVTNISVIKNGISDVFEKFEFDAEKNNYVKEKYELPENYILSLGTLEPRKNLKLLIKAFIDLKVENNIDKKLVLVGRKGWKLEEVIGNLDYRIINEDILLTGFVDDGDLPYIYLNSEFFVFPSIYEGFGIPVIEAGAMNGIVISSDIDVLKEVLGDDSIYFNSNNIESLKEVILEVLKYSEDKKNIVRKKFKENSKKYNWKIESLKLLNLINEL